MMLKIFDLEKINITNKKLSLIQDVVSVIFFAFLTALSANIKIEIGAVPITMQTLVVLLSGLFLGKKNGALSQTSYLFLGLLGTPWFARGGGLSYILSPTFGYLLGFIPASYIVGYLTEKNKKDTNLVFSFLLANLVIYSFGVMGLLRLFSFKEALNIGLYPFVLGEMIKIFLAITIFKIKK